MGEIKSHRDLFVWQKGIDLVRAVYRHTKQFPADERFALTSQIQRAAVSVPANIAEGWGRDTTPAYVNFLRIARGSLAELDTLLIIAKGQDYILPDDYTAISAKAEEVSRLLNALIRSLTKPKD